MPVRAQHSAAAHVSDDVNTSALDPGEQPWVEEWVLRDAIRAVTEQYSRVAAVELDVTSREDGLVPLEGSDFHDVPAYVEVERAVRSPRAFGY